MLKIYCLYEYNVNVENICGVMGMSNMIVMIGLLVKKNCEVFVLWLMDFGCYVFDVIVG